MNLGDIKLRVRRSFGDESAVQVTDADILRWVNDGQREVVMQNPQLLEAIGTASVVAGQQDYTFPADMRMLRSVNYKSAVGVAFTPLKGQSLQEFDEYVTGWDGSLYGQSDPIIYCTFSGNFKLFPIPATSVTGGLKLYYYRQPTDRAIDADVLDLPLGYHSAVVEYCLKQAYEMDEDWTSVGNKAQEFNAAVSGQKNQEKDQNQETYTRITILQEDAEWS